MNDLILIRHGQAEHLVKDLTGGWTDSSLTGLGRDQAERIARRLAALLDGVSYEIYSSDLVRAVETAEIIGRVLSWPPILTPALRDQNNGIAANRTKTEARRLRVPMSQPLIDWIAFPEAENWRMMLARLTPFLESLLTREAEVIVLISHRNVVTAIVQWWLGMPEALLSTTDFEAEPGSLAHLKVMYWGGRGIHKLNETSHL
jgi:probable phosphoglycerate mutase